jgi:DNA end-binding protein Ku
MLFMSTERATPSSQAGPIEPAAASGPRGRASWSGLLRLSLVAVPVKAYPAVSTSDAVHFNQLHADCGQRISYQKCCLQHGPVDAGAIVRGYQYAPGQYVIIEPAELEPLRPAKEKALLLEQFVDASQVDPVLFSGRTLYLLPDGLAAHRPYLVLVEAMQQCGRWALGRVTMSGNRQLVLVRPAGRLLAMDVLHYPAQLRSRASLEGELGGRGGSEEELRLAGLLIEAASRPIDWQQYRDDTADKIRALIEAKIEGRPLQAPAEEPLQVLQLLDALKQSVAAAGGAEPAGGPKPRKASRRRSA